MYPFDFPFVYTCIGQHSSTSTHRLIGTTLGRTGKVEGAPIAHVSKTCDVYILYDTFFYMIWIYKYFIRLSIYLLIYILSICVFTFPCICHSWIHWFIILTILSLSLSLSLSLQWICQCFVHFWFFGCFTPMEDIDLFLIIHLQYSVHSLARCNLTKTHPKKMRLSKGFHGEPHLIFPTNLSIHPIYLPVCLCI